MMKINNRLFLVKRTDHISYDEYDSMICVAENEDFASKMIPCDDGWFDCKVKLNEKVEVEVTFIGLTELPDGTIVHTSYVNG